MSQRSKVHQPDFKYRIVDVKKIGNQKIELKDTTVTWKTAHTRKLKNKFNET